ncbi:MAG: cation diffusion facilitator family transporter [Thermoplasmatota archaeon]
MEERRMLRTARQSPLGYAAVGLSIGGNVVLFGVKYWVGLSVDSVAMQADAWHTLSDTLTSVIVLLGFYMAARPPDREHPFGHGRAESIAAVVIGTLLAVVAFSFLQDSLASLLAGRTVGYSGLSILVFLASVFVKEAMAQVSMYAGRKHDSPALIADGWHHRGDALTSLLIVVGAWAGGSYAWIDGALGVMVSAFIFYAAGTILRDVVTSLLGERPSPELRQRIAMAIGEAAPEASDVHHIHMHRYGDHREMTVHIRLPDDMPMREAHAVASRVEEVLYERFGIAVTVHVDPLSDGHV